MEMQYLRSSGGCPQSKAIERGQKPLPFGRRAVQPDNVLRLEPPKHGKISLKQGLDREGNPMAKGTKFLQRSVRVQEAARVPLLIK